MKVFAEVGDKSIASVYLADFGNGKLLEFVEAIQPPYPRDERWILMVSTLYGCPCKCIMCDAGGFYQGKPDKDQILAQIDYLVDLWYPDRVIPCTKFKIQFARMGEPSLNDAVLDVLSELPGRFKAPGLIPSISTVAPIGRDRFFERLIEIKDEFYSSGNFQFQYSIHTTDENLRDKFIPIRKWNFKELAGFGDKFYKPSDRKITLNFALADNVPLDAEVLINYFDPSKFLVKITPVNPTARAEQNEINSFVNPFEPETIRSIEEALQNKGYEVIVSIGEIKENEIGSNCGQYVLNYINSSSSIENGYTYPIQKIGK